MPKKKVSKKRRLLPLALIVVLSGAAVLFALEKAKITDLVKNPEATIIDTLGPTEEEQAEEARVNAENKQQLIDQEANTEKDETPTVTPTPAQSQKIDLSGRRESNGSVTVFTKLYNYSSGTCTLTVTNGSKTDTQNAPLMYQPEYSSCAGFSVNADTLGEGTWNIKLSVNSNGATTTKNISFEVE